MKEEIDFFDEILLGLPEKEEVFLMPEEEITRILSQELGRSIDQQILRDLLAAENYEDDTPF